MQQLNFQDAGFVYQETDKTPMHISGVGIFDQSISRSPRMSLAELKKYIELRIHQAPILKKKLHHVPFELERPYWVQDTSFDIEEHIFQVTLPKPGNKQQLTELIAELSSPRMSFNKPLWEIYLIEGLNDYPGVGPDSFAMLTKIHHCCVDGGSGNNLYAALVDLEPNPVILDVDVDVDVDIGLNKDPSVSRYRQFLKAYTNNARDIFNQSAAVSRRVPALSKVAANLYRGKLKSGSSLSVPSTRFNRTPDSKRVFGFTDFDLNAIKAIKNTVSGVTVNDVMVCIVSGGMRNFLQYHNELPAQSLGAMMPKNLREGSEHDQQSGNKVGGVFASIHTNISDPKERLLAISESTQQAKKFSETAGTAAIFPHLMGGFLYPKVGKKIAKITQDFRLMERVGPIVLNTVITNVVGPSFDLFHAGAKQQAFIGLPPLTDGVAISHAIYSLKHRVSLGVVSCPSMIDDGQFYIKCCEDAFIELANQVLN